nr:uncharacterized protein LOC109749946 [Aegilops tauschii subsp. strangulata]
MTEGHKYQSSISEWAALINGPKEEENDVDVYEKPRMDHNSMVNMYKETPKKDLGIHKPGSVKHLLAGLATTNTILRHTLLPKSGDDKMIRGHSINLLHLFDNPRKFKVMSLIVETVKRIVADQKRSCGYAPHIQMLINSKVGTETNLLDREHLPLQPEFEDNVVMMDSSHPTSVEAQEEIQAAAVAKATKEASAPNAPIANLKLKNDQMTYLLEATLRIERSLANISKNKESLERVVETKINDLDVKISEVQTVLEKLQSDVEASRIAAEDSGDKRPATQRFQTIPRAPRSSAVPVADMRPTHSVPAATALVPPPVSTPPVQQTSSEAFTDALLSTPSTHTGATSQKTPSGTLEDRS